ncbi:MAG: hypothetical protein OEY28_06355, partial [Nitrospira sp.]|nr:hypothetical protein [Nitrospira sp.]
PSLSGIEVAREISAINPAIPLVLVSGYLSPADHAAVLTAGIREVVDKPTMLRVLGEVLTKLFKEEDQDHAGQAKGS